MSNPIDNLETLTTENAVENLIIISVNNPEWGTWRLSKDRNGWIKSAPRRSTMIDEGEFHFWKIVIDPTSDNVDRKTQNKINNWTDSLSGRLSGVRNAEANAWREHDQLKG